MKKIPLFLHQTPHTMSSDEFTRLKNEIFQYRYTHMSTWKSLTKNLSTLKNLAANTDEQKLTNSQDLQSLLAIAISYYIHQIETTNIMDKRNNHIHYAYVLLAPLLNLKTQPCYPLFLYLTARLEHCKKNQALTHFSLANESLLKAIRGSASNPYLKDTLIAMGALTMDDPQSMENIVLQAMVYNGFGNLLVDMKMPIQAIEYFEKAYKNQLIAYQKEEHPSVAHTLFSLGKALEHDNQFEQAQEKYEAAERISKKIYPNEKNTEVLKINIYLAYIYFKNKNNTLAKKYTEIASEISRELHGLDDFSIVELKNQIRNFPQQQALHAHNRQVNNYLI